MRIRAAGTLTAALLVLTACSSQGDDPAPANDSGTPAAEPTVSVPAEHEGDDLKAAVAVYTAAYFAADADTAYGMLSTRCAEQTTKEAYAGVVEQANVDYGEDHPATDITAQVSGTLARVAYKVQGLPKFDQQAQPWTLEGDAWKYDAC